ncbi:MAG: histidine kinase [Lachnospiraceae bacterium]
MNSRKKRKQYSLRFKLIAIFFCTSLLTAIINIVLYNNLEQTISKIDSVYVSNEYLNQLSEDLGNVQKNVYQYLNTKSSKALENYYRYEQDYREQAEKLNHEISGDQVSLMEKNIYYMSRTYLEQTAKTVNAKRARNISKYKENYEEATRLYNDIDSFIYTLNNMQFQENSENYVELRDALNYMVLISAGILLIALILTLLFTIVMTQSITKPIGELAIVSNKVAAGDFDVEVPFLETADELGALSRAFNKMLESIRNYIQQIKENYERENSLKENALIMKNHLKDAQLKYLQAQINPHFLFNTLNAGAQLAMMEDAEKTCLFIQNMADFFRYNVHKINTDTTLEEEIALVDSYLYILNVRFSGDIHFRKQLDSRFLKIQVPSMILQPIVENAVNHGIRSMEGKGEICLSIYQERDCVCISIKDNGLGMTQETISKLLHGEEIHSDIGDSTGIGMGRLRRYYDREKVISIRSEGKEKGTEVILYVPIDTREDPVYVPNNVG